MLSDIMEILETIGWISLGFVLEVGSRNLAKRISPKLLLNLRGKK
jgi:hypothetical protein